MSTMICVLTWNRLSVLVPVLESLQKNCGQHQIAVFEDAGVRDNTVGWVLENFPIQEKCPKILSVKCTGSKLFPNVTFFLGAENLGVAGNSNRAIKWFMDSDCDFLCLNNDDVLVKGDFTKTYLETWNHFKIGLLCYCGINAPGYECESVPTDKIVEGKKIILRKLRRLTGSMMAMPRELIEKIGYFDLIFGKFGEEHCAYTTRANIAGYQNIFGQSWCGIDVEHDLLEQLDVSPSMNPQERAYFNEEAAKAVPKIDYVRDGYYRSFALKQELACGGIENNGILESHLQGWEKVPEDLEQSILNS